MDTVLADTASPATSSRRPPSTTTSTTARSSSTQRCSAGRPVPTPRPTRCCRWPPSSSARAATATAPWPARSSTSRGTRRAASARASCSPTPSVGNAEQYAAAMALMANRLRVPARVVVGAVVPASGVVKGKNVTAWVELRDADGTWQTLETDRFMSASAAAARPRPGCPEARADLPRGDPRRAVALAAPRTAAPARPAAAAARRPARPTGRARPGPPLWPWLTLLLLVAVPGVVPALKWWRRRRRLTATRVSERYAGAWLELVDQARDLGRAVPPGLTRPAEARALDAAPPGRGGRRPDLRRRRARSGRGRGVLGPGSRRTGGPERRLFPLAAPPGRAQPRLPAARHR